MFKTNTIAKKWFTHKTIIHISIARTEQNQILKMLRTLEEKTITAHKKKQGKRDEQTQEDERRQDNHTVKTTRRTKQHNTLTRTKQGKTFEDKTKEMRNEQEKTSTALKGTYNTDKYIKRMNMN